MKSWKRNLFTVAGVIVVGYILFIVAEVMDASHAILIWALKLSPILFILLVVICFVMGKREREMPQWRKRLWQVGLVSFVLVILIFVVIFSGHENILPQWIKSMGPVVLFPLSTGCFGVYFATRSMRGNKTNMDGFHILIGILIFAVGCLLAFGWFALGHPTW